MQSNGPGETGHIATLFREARKLAGYTKAKLAELAGVTRPTLDKAESGSGLPTLDICAKLATPLSLPLLVVMPAHSRDALHDNPEALARLEEELAGSRAYIDTLTQFYGLKVAEVRYEATVRPDGSLELHRISTGCIPTRELSMMSFWTTVTGEPGDDTPSLHISGAAMNYDHQVRLSGNQRTDEFHFPEPWRPDGPPVTLDYRATYHHAYARSLPGITQGDFRVYVRHLVDRITVVLRFPHGYTPSWDTRIIAYWDTRPLDPTQDAMSLKQFKQSGLCKDADFHAETATLTIVKPAPGFTFGVRWTPPEGWTFQRGDPS